MLDVTAMGIPLRLLIESNRRAQGAIRAGVVHQPVDAA